MDILVMATEEQQKRAYQPVTAAKSAADVSPDVRAAATDSDLRHWGRDAMDMTG